MQMGFRVGLDCGGTFTDGVAVDERGAMVTAKVPTTPEDLTLGIMNDLALLAQRNNLSLKEFLRATTLIVHGTTYGINLLITRTGPKTGLIATRGHRDAIEFRRVIKEDMFNWRMPCPKPLVPRRLRTEVEERLGIGGQVKVPLDENSVRQAVAHLKKREVKSIAVSLLFSFLNPAHERRVAEIIKEDYPEAHVSLSSTVLPAIGEFERTSTAIIDAYIALGIEKYLNSLHLLLEKDGFKGELLLMQSNGGVGSWQVVTDAPATLAISGLAAAPSSAILMGRLHGEDKVISMDMGGTSFECLIIDKGNYLTTTESLISDLRYSLPSIDIHTIGAGGGSIAWFDTADILRVGPRSAAASPGPACYGRGGGEATVTDADVVLGYISPDFFLGGEIPLRKELAEKAIKEKVADRLGVSVVEGAAAIHRIINAAMAANISSTVNKRGYDYRDFCLCAGGSASPTHAIGIMRELDMKRLFITKFAPFYSAFGMLGVDLKHDYTRFYYAQKQALDLERVRKLYDEMEAEADQTLAREGVPRDKRKFVRSMDLRYYGQFNEVEVEWPTGAVTDEAISAGVANFHAKHKELYGYSNEKYPIELMSFKLSARGAMPHIELTKIGQGDRSPSAALKGVRDAYFEDTRGFVETRIYDGDRLLGGNILEGPCIVEERATTIVVPPGFKIKVDEYGNCFTIV
ncbi:MAG: hypothetical protein A3G80_07570 [Betaproteobacteria bacterium RIFCSPLOWO2_12_FULL_62_13b]|nr:MAG: hypothetical protein A3G80_07570 [Betaproteobacteria bacterium RIFCSPLOWO2_12_FULL_62_13b]